MPNSLNRRSFLGSSGYVAGAAALMSSTYARAAGSNQKLRIGMIGPGGRGFGAHVKSISELEKSGRNVEMVAVADVYSHNVDQAVNYIAKTNGHTPAKYVDYRDMIEKEKLDAVCIGTPDHWHHKQIVDCLNAGLHVYAEKPMTKTVEEALDVVKVWNKSGKVMQVGVQGSSNPLLKQVREMVEDGKLGKVLMYQTAYFRNSNLGQWRYYKLTKEMTPKTIDWQRWLGVQDGLAEDVPFDREIYAQWRRFWPYGSGMFTDLFVHRVTEMLTATGLKYPARVTGAGGIYLEYDGRNVPDVATVIADYNEGVQGLISSTMCSQATALEPCIRGHFGSFVFNNSNTVRFVPERPQVTGDSNLKEEVFTAKGGDPTLSHFANWIDAIEAGEPGLCNNTPEKGAAALAAVILGAQSYRQGIVYNFDPEAGSSNAFLDAQNGKSWAKKWETVSAERGKAVHIPGWKAGDYGSTIVDPPYMSLAGPWVNGKPPEKS
ncbi:Gfo/Idh/MocA family protein [Planctomicrobium sp. SH664]|uniref:Gfo/Idh/MocA family protein n=1 Tax=Planctomicrobium sp. SH664 TaxID=3448125 RepID=UPI003F5BABC2